MKNISFSIPMTTVALTATANMLLKINDCMINPLGTVNLDADADLDQRPGEIRVINNTHDEVTVEKVEEVVASTMPELDGAGMPWDVRIHSANKTKNKGDHCWKKKRGVSSDLVAKVEAEIKAVMEVPLPSHEEMIDKASDVINAHIPPLATLNEVLKDNESSAPPPPPAPDVEPKYITGGKAYTEAELLKAQWLIDDIRKLPVSEPQTTDFAGLVSKITSAINAGDLTQGQVDAAVHRVKLTAMTDLLVRPDLIPTVEFELFKV